LGRAGGSCGKRGRCAGEPTLSPDCRGCLSTTSYTPKSERVYVGGTMAVRLSKVADEGLHTRVPPNNLEAEESVLGACLLSRDAIANVLEILGPEDFYKPAHTEIFNAILALYGKGEPVDAVTLSEELRRMGTLEALGGKPYIHTLVSSVPTAGAATHYARIVEENALLRRLAEAAHQITDLAYSVPEDVEEAV